MNNTRDFMFFEAPKDSPSGAIFTFIINLLLLGTILFLVVFALSVVSLIIFVGVLLYWFLGLWAVGIEITLLTAVVLYLYYKK